MKDFLGNDFGPGDLIVYPKSSGRSVALVKGRVIKFNESGTVSVQPEVESWGGGRERSGTERYIDTRTGKGFDPWAEKNAEHLVRQYGRVHKTTGEYLTSEQYWARERELMPARGYGAECVELSAFRDEWDWCNRIFKDYVKVEKTVKPVTISRTDNIILVKEDNA